MPQTPAGGSDITSRPFLEDNANKDMLFQPKEHITPELYEELLPTAGSDYTWSDLYPNDEFDAAAKALRPEMKLFTKSTARLLIIKHQASDKHCIKTKAKLAETKCTDDCTKCCHSPNCLHSRWIVEEDAIYEITIHLADTRSALHYHQGKQRCW